QRGPARPTSLIDVQVPSRGPGDHQHRPRFRRLRRPDSKSGRDRRVRVPARADVRQDQAGAIRLAEFGLRRKEARLCLRARRLRWAEWRPGAAAGAKAWFEDQAYEIDSAAVWEVLRDAYEARGFCSCRGGRWESSVTIPWTDCAHY
ncbi:unnamed protein product, partial [Musa acuminata var. zebrina]